MLRNSASICDITKKYITAEALSSHVLWRILFQNSTKWVIREDVITACSSEKITDESHKYNASLTIPETGYYKAQYVLQWNYDLSPRDKKKLIEKSVLEADVWVMEYAQFIKLNWEDLKSFEYKFIFNPNELVIEIDLGEKKKGDIINLDPTTVATGASVNTALSARHTLFKVSGGYYFFIYCDGTNVVYKSSADGVTWGSATTIAANASSGGYAAYYDGTYVYVVYQSSGDTDVTSFQRGTISSGTITWGTAYTCVAKPSTDWHSYYPALTVDGDGQPWVCVVHAFSWNNSHVDFYQCDAGDGSGSWTNKKATSQFTSNYGRNTMVTLPTSGDVMLFGWEGWDNAVGYLYDLSGDTVGGAETATDYDVENFGIASVGDGDNIHLIYVVESAYEVYIAKRTSGAWGIDALLKTTGDSTTSVAVSMYASDVYGIYSCDGHIYYKVYSGSWGSEQTLEDEQSKGAALHSWENSVDNKILVGWAYEGGATDKIQFSTINLAEDSSADLSSEFLVRHNASADLKAVFEIQSSTTLKAVFEVRQSGSVELKAVFDVGQNSTTLKAVFEVRYNGSAILPAKFVVQHSSTWRVGASSDDAFRRLLDLPGSFSLSLENNIAGYWKVDDEEYGSGMRFTSINIPQGATIISASLILTCSITNAVTTVKTRISAEDVDDAATFTNTAAFDLKYANRTTMQVDWDISSGWTLDAEYTSPDIGQVIQEIVNRAGWVSGNDLVLLWEDFENRSDKNESCRRHAYAWDGDSAKAPMLSITWTVAERDLRAEFVVRKESTSDLGAEFEVQQESAAGLEAEFDVRQSAAIDLLSKFLIRRSSSTDLKAVAEIRNTGSVALPAELVVGASSASADLLGVADVRNAASAVLPADLEVQHSESVTLFADFVVAAPGSASLHAEFVVQQESAADLEAEFDVRQSASTDLKAVFKIQRSATTILKAILQVQHSASVEFKAIFTVKQESSADLLAVLEVRHPASEDLYTKIAIQHSSSTALFAKLKVTTPESEDLLAVFIVRHEAVANPVCYFIVRHSASVNLFADFVVAAPGSASLHAEFVVQYVRDLSAEFRVNCSRRFGENWQRKMWHCGLNPVHYYWRGRYDPTANEIKVEYIAEEDLKNNVWIENTTAAIDCTGFTGLAADFSIRGNDSGSKTTIVYSDGVDVWIAESDEASVTGWGWQNLTKVFDGTAPDYYRKVNMSANRQTPTPRLWVTAVFYDNATGKQSVKASGETAKGDITGWDAEVDISNVDNTDEIYGQSIRSMGKKDIMVVYKEGVAIRSRYWEGVAWQVIQDVDTNTILGKARFDFEHGEVAGEDKGHIVYVDSDGTVKWVERISGDVEPWDAPVTISDSAFEHYGLGIVEHGSGWLWVTWVHQNHVEYRLHICSTEVWIPALVNSSYEYDPATEGIIKTSTVAQVQTPDSIDVDLAIPICWIGETSPSTPCAVGWGILIDSTLADLKAVFTVSHSGSAVLKAVFDVGQGSHDLLARLLVTIPGSQDLYGKTLIRHSASSDLVADAVIRSPASINLASEFTVRQSSYASLKGQMVLVYPSEELISEVVIRHTSTRNLRAIFDCRNPTSTLFSKFEARHSSSLEFDADFTARHSGSEAIYSNADIRQASTKNLTGLLVVKHNGSSDLTAVFTVDHVVDLLSRFKVRPSVKPIMPRGIIDDDIEHWINFTYGLGNAFIGMPTITTDSSDKVTGKNSVKLTSAVEEHAHEAIKFGWLSEQKLAEFGDPTPCCPVTDWNSLLKEEWDWEDAVYLYPSIPLDTMIRLMWNTRFDEGGWTLANQNYGTNTDLRVSMYEGYYPGEVPSQYHYNDETAVLKLSLPPAGDLPPLTRLAWARLELYRHAGTTGGIVQTKRIPECSAIPKTYAFWNLSYVMGGCNPYSVYGGIPYSSTGSQPLDIWTVNTLQWVYAGRWNLKMGSIYPYMGNSGFRTTPEEDAVSWDNDEYESFPITTLLKGWLQRTYENNGLMVEMSSDVGWDYTMNLTSNKGPRFYSWDNGSNRPRFRLQFWPAGKQDVWNFGDDKQMEINESTPYSGSGALTFKNWTKTDYVNGGIASLNYVTTKTLAEGRVDTVLRFNSAKRKRIVAVDQRPPGNIPQVVETTAVDNEFTIYFRRQDSTNNYNVRLRPGALTSQIRKGSTVLSSFSGGFVVSDWYQLKLTWAVDKYGVLKICLQQYDSTTEEWTVLDSISESDNLWSDGGDLRFESYDVDLDDTEIWEPR